MSERVRLDVWLDVACLARTRSHAKELCDGGKVEVGGEHAKAHRLVQAGDRVRVTLGPGHARELVVRAVRDTHVAKALARELGVAPRVALEDGLARTAAWFSARHAGRQGPAR